MQLTELYGEIIVSDYTRGQALADGAMIDVTSLADIAGFPMPVAIAFHAHAEAVSWRFAQTLAECQDIETGRLWNVLAEARKAIHYAYATWQQGPVEFIVYRATEPGAAPKPVTLWVDMAPGDDGDPVVTISHAWDVPMTQPLATPSQGLDD